MLRLQYRGGGFGGCVSGWALLFPVRYFPLALRFFFAFSDRWRTRPGRRWGRETGNNATGGTDLLFVCVLFLCLWAACCVICGGFFWVVVMVDARTHLVCTGRYVCVVVDGAIRKQSRCQ